MKRINLSFVNEPILDIEDFFVKLRKNGDFWRLHLDYCRSGMNKELGVYSHQQKTPQIIKKNGEVSFVYPEIVAEDGSVHNIQLELNCVQTDEGMKFSATMKNNSNVRINELQYPLFEFEQINENLDLDELILPQGLGNKIKNPHDFIKNRHTEYMAADYKNIWGIYLYPGEMSMPWIGVQSGNKYLYMGWHSKIWREFTLTIGTEPRNSSEKYIIYAISSYPMVKPGENITYDDFVLAAFDGDWRNGVDFYRRWADKEWNTSFNKKHSVNTLCGWQRIILKHQYGEIFHTYDELPRIYEEGAKYGLNMILLFAWWEEGMDNGYPTYMPDPALGGAEKLREAIKVINEMGGIVVLYANGHLMDVSTDYYKTEGKNYTMKDIEKNEYREFYKFSNNGTFLKYGHKTFATGCHGTPQWRDKLVEIEKRHLELGSNGTFFDQLGICFNFCFDETHEHGNRVDLDPEFRLNTIKKMRQLLTDDSQYFGTEWTVDRLTVHMDFIHGCGFAQTYAEDAYPYIFKYAFPEAIISNRFIHDEREDWKQQLNYAFTYGLIFDVSIYRGRAQSIEETPNYAKYVGQLISLRRKYNDYFTAGQINIPDVALPDNVHAAEFVLNNKKIMTVWNNSDNCVSVMGREVPIQKVDVIEMR